MSAYCGAALRVILIGLILISYFKQVQEKSISVPNFYIHASIIRCVSKESFGGGLDKGGGLHTLGSMA